PDAGAIEGDEEQNICPGNPITLTVEDATQAGNMTYQWQTSPGGEDDWSDMEGENSFTLNLPDGIEEDTDYRFYVKCNNSDMDDHTDPVSFVTNPPNDCYCTPGNSTSYYISSFSTSGGDENIDQENSAPFENGYADHFDEQTVSRLKTLSVDFDAVFGGSTSLGFRIWVDWNQDGIFDDDEVVYQSAGYDDSASGTIEIP